ncbi:unnamed protein product, partial [Ceratitis capitata]
MTLKISSRAKPHRIRYTEEDVLKQIGQREQKLNKRNMKRNSFIARPCNTYPSSDAWTTRYRKLQQQQQQQHSLSHELTASKHATLLSNANSRPHNSLASPRLISPPLISSRLTSPPALVDCG